MSRHSTPDDLATPAGTARVIRTFGLRPRKRWGQHFLISHRALDRILEAANLSAHDSVLEVGAGLGTLTAALAVRVGRVVAVEVDPALLPPLQATLASCPNVMIVNGDIMSLDLAPLLDGLAGPRKVVANLPYNLASPLIIHLLERSLGFVLMVLTVQREVAERLTAVPGSKDYGALSVAVQYRAFASVVGRIPPSGFYPPPEVESAIVRLDVRGRPACAVQDEATFFRVVRAAFAQRRKTLRNALAGTLPLTPAEAQTACNLAGIAPGRRGETLNLDEFAALANAVAPVVLRRIAAHVGGKE